MSQNHCQKEAKLAVPTFEKFIEPILRYLASHPEGALARDVYEVAAAALNLSDDDKQELLPSGMQPIYKNRAGWAHDRLKRAGFSSSARRGYWKLTDNGIAYAQGHVAPLSSEEVEKLAFGFMDVRLRQTSLGDPISSATSPLVMPEPSLSSPDDRLGTAITEIRGAVADELLEILATVSPTFFEAIVLDLLHRMGYGASRADLQRVGGVGDGGIDGVISLDKLGLEKVHVQAKRWQQNVGRPEVQAFYGALRGQRANKGVLITTSGFTAQAEEYAKSVEGIVLVNGSKLVELMIDHGVGVSTRNISVPKLDSDYFDE